MTSVYADLHVHSSASDGVLSPVDLVKASKNAGLSVVGITDHDTVKGVAEALAAGAEQGIQVVPGIELSCAWPDFDIPLHVVGLFMDHTSKTLVELLETQRRSRYSRALKILELLENLGIEVTPLRNSFLADPEKLLGRPHIARYLVEIGAVSEFQEAFGKYLKRGAPAHVPKDHLVPETGIKAIHEAGGLAIIAHPGLTVEWEKLWSRISGLPWDGIEVYYSEHSPDQVEYFLNLARSRQLLVSGGSDYHGEYGKHASRLGLFGLERQSFELLEAAADLDGEPVKAVSA